jgi:hypothetical protein
MTPGKSWWQSWTIWLNLLSVIAVAIGLIGQNAGTLQLSSQTIAYGTIALAVVNALIRVLRTGEPIAGSPAVQALRRRSGGPA